MTTNSIKVATWFSKYLLNKDEGLRLVFYPSDEPKPSIPQKDYLYKTAEREDTGSFHGETSYMLMNMGSFDDFNKKIDKPVTPLQFRPNFVVKGAKAWAEDKWKFVKIGQVIFETTQPCTRCIRTAVDPYSGERMEQMEPLRTLKKFRLFSNICNKSPVFGIHLGLRSSPGSSVKVGEDVYVSH
jgi:uncharacterized protein YcbX